MMAMAKKGAIPVTDAHKATGSNPESILFARHAAKLAEAEEYDQAITVLNEGIGHHPSYSTAYQVLGDIHARRGETGQAMELFERALALDPQNPRLLFRLGTLYLDEEPSRAQDLLWRARRYEPDVAEIEEAFARAIAGPEEETDDGEADGGSVVVIDDGGDTSFAEELEISPVDNDTDMMTSESDDSYMGAPDEELPEEMAHDDVPAEVAEAFTGAVVAPKNNLGLSDVTEQALTDLQRDHDKAKAQETVKRPLDDRDALEELVKTPGQPESDEADLELDDILAGFKDETGHTVDQSSGANMDRPTVESEDTSDLSMTDETMEDIEPYPPEPEELLAEAIDETTEDLGLTDSEAAFDSDLAFLVGEAEDRISIPAQDQPLEMEEAEEDSAIELNAVTGELPIETDKERIYIDEATISEAIDTADTGELPVIDKQDEEELPDAALVATGETVLFDDEDELDDSTVNLSALFGGEIPDENETAVLDSIESPAAIDIDDATTSSYDALLEELEFPVEDDLPAAIDTQADRQIPEMERSNEATDYDTGTNSGEFVAETGTDMADIVDMVATGDYVLPEEYVDGIPEQATAPELPGNHEETDRESAISYDTIADELEQIPELEIADYLVDEEILSDAAIEEPIESQPSEYVMDGDPDKETITDESSVIADETSESEMISSYSMESIDQDQVAPDLSDEDHDTNTLTEEEAIAAYSKLLRDIDLSGIDTEDSERGVLEFGEEELSALTFDETTPHTIDEPVLSEEERAELSSLESITDDNSEAEPPASLEYEDILGGMKIQPEAADIDDITESSDETDDMDESVEIHLYSEGSTDTGKIVEEMMRGSMNIRLTPSEQDFESVEQSSLDSLINEYVSTLESLTKPAPQLAPQPKPANPPAKKPPTAPGVEPLSHGTDDTPEDNQDEATATMAEIYVKQGLIARAIGIYSRIAEKQPDNQAVRNRLDELTNLSTNMPGEE